LVEAVDHRYQDRLAEQLVINMCTLLSRGDLDGDEKLDRQIEIEDALIQGYFDEDKPLEDLKTLISSVQQKNKNLDNGDLRQVALHLKSRFASNEHAEKATELKAKAVRATVLSLVLVGIPFAIYYWREFKKVTEQSPVHVYQMPATTYAKLSRKLTLEKDGSITFKDNDRIFSEDNDHLKRVVSVVKDGDATPLFLADDIKAKSRLRIVCTDGYQADHFKEKIDALNPFDRLTVSTVL